MGFFAIGAARKGVVLCYVAFDAMPP